MKKHYAVHLAFALLLPMAFSGPSSAATVNENCQDILAGDPGASDGEYTIYPNNQIFTVYCHNMDFGMPAEFLSLVNTGEGLNFSKYTAGGAVYGTDVVTHYTKIRLDPETLSVDTGDQTFASSIGLLYHGGVPVTWMPFGAAEGCAWSANGQGNIDLTGLSFEVDDQFMIAGWNAAGTVADASGLLLNVGGVIGQVEVAVASPEVYLTGGGYCGWAGIVGNIAPNAGGGPLQLKYTGPTFGEIDIKPDSLENPVNLKSKGVIPVAILTNDSFDASEVNSASVVFAGAGIAHKHAHLEDVDGDGDIDWLGHFRTSEVNIATNATQASLEAKTMDGDIFMGMDDVRIVGGKKK